MSDINGYATHRTVLEETFKLASKFPGHVLECGTGDSSTRMLHNLCLLNNKMLISLDTDADWLNKYLDLASPDHLLGLVKGDWVKAINSFRYSYCLCFIDCSPAASRAKILRYMEGNSMFCVIHDSEISQGSVYGDLQSVIADYPYIKHDTVSGIRTTVVSGYIPL